MPSLERQWTVADLDALPEDGNRYEVIDGELFVTAMPAMRHQAAATELVVDLRPLVLRERLGYVFAAPIDVPFGPRRLVQPDVSVVPLVGGRRPECFIDAGRLLLAVEILSPSTARVDRVTKRMVYREENVDEYWIVDLDARVFERSTRAESRPEILADRMVWHPAGASSPLEIDLRAYFARVLDE